MWLGVLVAVFSLSLSFGSPQGNRAEVSNLIYDGIKQEQPFPPFVQLFNKKGAFCGGTILNHNHVLTAAHCLEGEQIDQVTVYGGLADLADTDHPEVQAMKVNRAIVHPFYSKATKFHDIAILVLNSSITYTNKIQPILIFAFDGPTELVVNQNVSIYGFGDTEVKPKSRNKKLYKADTTIFPRFDCAALWLANTAMHTTITLEQICTNAEKQGVLRGDSGGPVIHFYHNILTNQIETRQVGIVSFYAHDETNYRISNVHTRASSYCTWITWETTPLETFSCS